MFEFVDGGTPNIDVEVVKKYPSEMVVFEFGALEDLIEGYRTLTVSGRELLGKSVNYSQIEGVDGAVFNGANYGVRVLEVKYLLSGKNSRELLKKVNILNRKIRKPNMKFVIADEPEYFYIGTVQSNGNPEPGLLSYVGSFEIVCTDPFKYTNSVLGYTANETINMRTIGLNIPEECDIDLLNMEILPLSTQSSQIIEVPPVIDIDYIDTDLGVSKRYKIILKDTVIGGLISEEDPLLLDFENRMVTLEGVENINFKDWRSHFEEVRLSSESLITCEGYRIRIHIRGKLI